jgi:O-antigen biosynthesis protein
MNILIVHPEGNINYNTNLFGLVELLGDAGHSVTYVAPRRANLDQESRIATVNIKLREDCKVHGPVLFPGVEEIDDPATRRDFETWRGFDLVLGVDRGIIEAAQLARHYGISHALISYEIFFQAETSPAFVAPTTEACRDLSFATCQDSLRSRKLSLECGIAPDKIVHMPVAGRRFRSSDSKPRLLHEQFNLQPGTKTVLHMGSFADWTRAPYLLKSTHSWPEDWVLVIHERYGAANSEIIRDLGHPDRIRVSHATFANPDEMSNFVQSADLGVALYHPTYEHKWVGANLEHMGLSSGKISTYLQHGVPVAIHELGEISDWVRFYNAGQVFALDQPFVPESPDAFSLEGCRQLFEKHLDLDRFAETLLKAVSSSAKR